MTIPATKICIVGAGAAGMAAAWSLSRAGKFDVTIYEASDHIGGVATTLPISDGNCTSWINNQVQCGSPGYHNTKLFFSQFGFEFTSTILKIVIGAGEFAWNNQSATPFIKRMQPEIKRLHRILRTVHKLPFPFLFISIGRLLKLRGFGQEFIDYVMQPMLALFFASINNSLDVPATAVAQLVFDQDSNMFDFNDDTFVGKSPRIMVFPNLTDVYNAVATASGARIHLQRPVTSVIRQSNQVIVIDDQSNQAVFDAVIMACPPQVSLRLLSQPSLLERLVLGRIQREPADIVIHTDDDYLKRHYQVDADLKAQYYVRRRSNKNEFEMTYILNNYQDQLQHSAKTLYQTIGAFDEVDPASVIEKRTVTSIANNCKHFTSIVPLWRFIQGKRRTWFCGGYTLFEIHEMAIVSGLAVAQKLGSPYPFSAEPKAKKMFDMYFGLIHG